MSRRYTLRARAAAVERSRAAILAAARAQLAQLGYGRMRVADVARRARVAPRTVYAHFPTRPELAEAALRERANALRERVARWRPRSEDAAATIDEVVAFHARTYREEHGLLKTLVEGAPPEIARRLLRELDAERLRIIARVAQQLAAADALRVRAGDAMALMHAVLAYPAWRVAITGPAGRRAPRLLAAALKAALLS